MFLFAPLLVVLLATAPSAPGHSVSIATGDSVALWRVQPADGVSLALASDAAPGGRALRLDFDFHGGGGYAVAHRAVSLDLPANYRFRFRVKGDCAPNNLEFKLVDASGDNVWWCNQRDYEFPREWRDESLSKRRIGFAWGPAGGGELRHVAAIEFAITAGQGGKGSVWIDDLRLEPAPPPDTTAHTAVARATSGARTAALAVDGDAASAWTSEPRDREPALTVDFGAVREFGALTIDWAPGRQARDYAVEFSVDGRVWQLVHEARGSNGGRDWLRCPESEARFVRVRCTRAQSPDGVVGVANVALLPLDAGETPERFFGTIALASPRGTYPRAFLGQNVFWTVVGQDRDSDEGLLDEDGRLESGRGRWSVEPFVRDGGRTLAWNDVTTGASLREGCLPMPEVTWRADSLQLTVRAFAAGTPEHSALVARYRLRNLGSTPRIDTLYLAVRPLQVNPPTQFLGTRGGVAPIHELAADGRVVRVDGTRGLESLNPPDGFGCASFDQGDIGEWLRAGALPAPVRTTDASGFASGALRYVLDLPAGVEDEVDVLLPLHDVPVEPPCQASALGAKRYADALDATSAGRWHERLGRVSIALPDSDLVHALKAQLGYVLVNRDGDAIRPGTRSYARSWIRDGCLTSSALLRLGETDAVRAFIEWFVPYQYASGKAPCCVDRHGADPTPEHDSSGELIYLIAEYVRYTGDRAFAGRMWPHVSAAAAYLDTLRAQRLGPEWSGENVRFRGLLPPSISHEGYSAKPMHSYWDDLFALRGFKDAAWLATWLGKPDAAALAKDRDDFAADLAASIPATMRAKRVDYVPGCADLGDFDATSTSIALNPVQAGERVVSRAALERTYQRYWEWFAKRASGAESWDAFTPYEWRNVGAMTRLGWTARADSATRWLMQYRRPAGFQHWAEVVWHDERAPHFIGDMPHTWCGTDFVRAQLDRLAYEDESDSSLVIAAGVPESWLAGDGVAVKDLRTRWGAISFALSGGNGHGEATVFGPNFRMPPGGILVRPPNGPPEGLRVKALPATLRWH